MLLDKVNVTFKAGDGGNGKVSFKKIGRGPDGGSGGKGGDVYIVGDRGIFDFSKIVQTKTFRAESGHIGEKNKRTGKDGEDIERFAPESDACY